MDTDEPYWRINSSFSPNPFRVWDCRLQLDGMQYGPQVGHPHGSTSSPSSNSRGSRSIVGIDSGGNHHHSISDDVLSYSGSPPDNIQLPPLTSPIQKCNPGSVSQVSLFPHSSERLLVVNASEASAGFASPSTFQSSSLESTSKQHFLFNSCSFPSRRPHISKAVYPLAFHNPVSDREQIGDADNDRVGRVTPVEDRLSTFNWPANGSTHKLQKTLFELQMSEASPDLSASSRREGFRWSNASSYELELDGERFDVAEHEHAESLRSEVGTAGQKCAVCGKLLRQKSPWSSHRIMRCGDMPTIGVLSCSHVFHAECLEQVTPKNQIHDPPCPVCMRTLGQLEECSASVSEPLQMALRSLRRSRGVIMSEALEKDKAPNNIKGMMRSNWPLAAPKGNDCSSSSMKERLKRHFTFKGR